ncbi:MAG: hypothetical protein DMG84_24245 [Acidobacteria bacterium]|nr:MAG: hypothetical protein DMG84_24245 [Acidobacteriota bacterium]
MTAFALPLYRVSLLATSSTGTESTSQPDERLASRSDAGIQILAELGGVWRTLASIVKHLPRWVRDKIYNLIARNRYQLFGKYQTCQIPDEKYRSKFLDL